MFAYRMAIGEVGKKQRGRSRSGRKGGDVKEKVDIL
jgi:hypothetical protein